MTKTYLADAARFDKAFRAADALRTMTDTSGQEFTYIDETKVPAALVRSYQRFIQYGAANGLA